MNRRQHLATQLLTYMTTTKMNLVHYGVIVILYSMHDLDQSPTINSASVSSAVKLSVVSGSASSFLSRSNHNIIFYISLVSLLLLSPKIPKKQPENVKVYITNQTKYFFSIFVEELARGSVYKYNPLYCQDTHLYNPILIGLTYQLQNHQKFNYLTRSRFRRNSTIMNKTTAYK